MMMFQVEGWLECMVLFHEKANVLTSSVPSSFTDHLGLAEFYLIYLRLQLKFLKLIG